MNDTIIQWNYRNHIDDDRKMLINNVAAAYFTPNSIDAWRHKRMLKTINPIIANSLRSTWLTIGDGTYGSDAFYLKCHNVKATASSISDTTLVFAKERGFVEDFKEINAEEIHCRNDEYDYILCKEAFHHFPRPPLAFYEMLRVAKNAVVLIEPQEKNRLIGDIIKKVIKKLIRKDGSDLYEPCGNYIYRINIKEIEKTLLAINYPCIAYKRFNDFYLSYLTYADRSSYVKFFLLKTCISLQNVLATLRIVNYGLCTLVIFKEKPGDKLMKDLKRENFKVKCLTRNPYFKN
jgi:ubiquinone/menaquinone biosynthesis C-methylase UbiE